jgi:soluble lytic murein transglycosylase-like protein
VTIALILAAAAMAAQVPVALLQGLCWNESKFQNGITPEDGQSPSYGICQLKLRTAREMEPGVTPAQLLNPWVNARIAAKYLHRQLKRYRGDIPCGLTGYNRGHAKLCRARIDNSDNYTDTKYVRHVLKAAATKPWNGTQ